MPEGFRADMRHALGNLHLGNIPACVLPPNRVSGAFIIIVHCAAALDIQLIVRFIPYTGLGIVFIGRRRCQHAGRIIIPAGVIGIFLQPPGHTVAAGAAHGGRLRKDGRGNGQHRRQKQYAEQKCKPFFHVFHLISSF